MADERHEIGERVVPVLLVLARRPTGPGRAAAPAVRPSGSRSGGAVLRVQALLVPVVAGRGERDHRAVLESCTKPASVNRTIAFLAPHRPTLYLSLSNACSDAINAPPFVTALITTHLIIIQ